MTKNMSAQQHSHVWSYTMFVSCKGDSIPRKLDLIVGPDGNKRRNRDEIRKLLLMRECRSVHDVSGGATRVRDALCGKLWVEKENWESFLT